MTTMTEPACLTVPAARPDRLAVVTDGQSLTHGRLDRWTEDIAGALLALGIGPGRVVGVAADGSAGAVAALLATLRVGATYTRVDPGAVPPAYLSCLLTADLPARPGAVPVLPLHGPPADDRPAGDGIRVALGGRLDDDVLVDGEVTVGGRALRAYLRWALRAYPFAAGRSVLPALPARAAQLTALLVPVLAGGCVRLCDREDAARSGWRPSFGTVAAADLARLVELPDEASPTAELVVTGPRLPRDDVHAWRRRHPQAALTWEYAPADGEFGCAARRLRPGDPLPDVMTLGLPLPGVTLHLMDGSRQPTATGDVGDLYVGGDPVPAARPGRSSTAGVVVAPSGARLRRTGDLGRRRPEGCIELVGRVPEAGAAQVGPGAGGHDWESIYDELYTMVGGDLGADFSCWSSSYTGDPMPLAQMREWQSSTLDRIRALRPRRVLEIGVGVGALLSRLAPDCAAYWATDRSSEVIRRLAEQIAVRPDLAGRVVLRHRPAHDLSGLPAGSFDVVVINSVVQSFPTLQYLDSVLARAVAALRPGGAVFVGDVRNARLAHVLQAAVRLLHADHGEDPAQVWAEVSGAVALDPDLLVDPDFFASLPARLSGVTHVDVCVKRGRFHNELTRHRYDVVVRTAAPARPVADPVPCTVEELPALLDAGVPAVRLTGLPNARLTGEVAAAAALAAGAPVAACRRNLTEPGRAVDPEHLAALGEGAGYEVAITWSDASADGSVDMLFTATREPVADAGAVAAHPARVGRAVPC